MGKLASVARMVTYAHKPKDGRTPVYDAATKKWTYESNPPESVMQSTTDRLVAVDTQLAATAAKADLATEKATAAQTTADSKATAEEAVKAAKSDLFEIVPLDPGDGIMFQPADFRKIRFVETGDDHASSTYEIFICTGDGDAPNSFNSKWLNYATREVYDNIDALEKRIAAIEKLHGIS